MRKKVFLILVVIICLSIAGVLFAATDNHEREQEQTQTLVPIAATDNHEREQEQTFVPTSDPSLKLDSEGDGMNDWFEKNIAKTDPYIYNARFVIFVYVDICSTHIPIPKDPDMEQHWREFFVEKEKIPAENVFLLIGNWEDGATFPNFLEAVSKVAERSNEESFVFVSLWSHGVKNPRPSMNFADGKGYDCDGVPHYYSEISEILNRIKCKMMLVGVDSCAFESALEPLAKDAAYPRIVVRGTSNLAGTLGKEAIYYSISDVIYGNGDGYVSCEEAVQFLINDGLNEYVEPKEPRWMFINDESGDPSMIYLGDFIPKAYSYNRVILEKLKENGEYHGVSECSLKGDREIE